MTKRSPRIGAAVAFCVLLAAGYFLFTYEVEALSWHLVHGRTLRWNGFEIGIPLKYDVNTTASRTVQIFTVPGRLRARFKAPWGAITIIRARDVAEASEIENLDERIGTERTKQGFRLIKTQSLLVAGVPMRCDEQLAENFRSYGPASIVHCQANNRLLFAQFEGNTALLDEFYSVASGIKSVAKN